MSLLRRMTELLLPTLSRLVFISAAESIDSDYWLDEGRPNEYKARLVQFDK